MQEETETFGVLTKRVDVMDQGVLKHVRDSVTTQVGFNKGQNFHLPSCLQHNKVVILGFSWIF